MPRSGILSGEDRVRLEAIRRSRTEEKRRTVRAAILLDAADEVSDKANAAGRQVNRNTAILCVRTSAVTEIVKKTTKAATSSSFLAKLDGSYPASRTLRLILDNHSAHISKETQRYLATRPQRFQFVFRPRHGSWLNLVENLFSKMTRTYVARNPSANQTGTGGSNPPLLSRTQRSR